MIVKHKAVLDVTSPNIQCVLKMTKGDTSSHEIFVSLRNKGENIRFDGNESAYLHAKKPDGTETVTSGVVYTSCGAYPDQIVFTLTQLTLAAVGRVQLRIVIDSIDGEELYSPVMVVDVVSNAALDAAITSQSEFTALTNAKLDAEAWARGTKGGVSVALSAEQYKNNAKYYSERAGAALGASLLEAEAWAKGTKNGTPVTNGSDQYENNSKYYSELAAQYADEAGGCVDDAGSEVESAEAWATGKKNGVSVGSDAEQYENNAKHYAARSEYYADQADSAARRVNTAAEQAIAAIMSATGPLETELNTNLLTQLLISISGDTVSFLTNKMNPVLKTSGQDSVILPLATALSAGAMSPADVIALQTLVSKVASLEGRAVRLMYTDGASPTAAQIAAFVAAAGYTQNLEYIAVVVAGTYHVWHYYTLSSAWQDDGVDTVSQFTNLVAGIIRGAAVDGKVYAENDGTGSVYGWDALKGRITNLESAVSNLGDMLYSCTYGTTLYSEIRTAIAAGKMPYCIYGNPQNVYFVQVVSNTQIIFINISYQSSSYVIKKIAVTNTNTWSNATMTLQGPLSGVSGYDATKTQVLTNNAGAIEWDEGTTYATLNENLYGGSE